MWVSVPRVLPTTLGVDRFGLAGAPRRARTCSSGYATSQLLEGLGSVLRGVVVSVLGLDHFLDGPLLEAGQLRRLILDLHLQGNLHVLAVRDLVPELVHLDLQGVDGAPEQVEDFFASSRACSDKPGLCKGSCAPSALVAVGALAAFVVAMPANSSSHRAKRP